MANKTLDELRKGTIKYNKVRYYLNVPTDPAVPGTKAFHRAYLNMNGQDKETGVETETSADVTMDVQTTFVKSYTETQPFEGTILEEDPVSVFLYNIYRKKAVGGDAQTEMIEEVLWGPDKGKAFKKTVTIVVETLPDNVDDGFLRITGYYGTASDEVEGTVSVEESTGVATFTEKSAEE